MLQDNEYGELLYAKKATSQDWGYAHIVIKPRYTPRDYDKDDTKRMSIIIRRDNTLKLECKKLFKLILLLG